MRLTPTERDRLLIFTAAELARARRARGLRLNVPEATALIADTVCEAARDGKRLAQAIDAGRTILTADDVLPGVPDILTTLQVEAVFDDGTRLCVIDDPFHGAGHLGPEAPGAALPGPGTGYQPEPPTIHLPVHNTAPVPITVTSHFHFFEANPRLAFDRATAYGTHLAIPAGSSIRFDPHTTLEVPLAPITGQRITIGFAGLVDGPLDTPGTRETALQRAHATGYLTTYTTTPTTTSTGITTTTAAAADTADPAADRGADTATDPTDTAGAGDLPQEDGQ